MYVCYILFQLNKSNMAMYKKKQRNKIINLLRVMHLLHHRSRKNTSKTNQIFSSSN